MRQMFFVVIAAALLASTLVSEAASRKEVRELSDREKAISMVTPPCGAIDTPEAEQVDYETEGYRVVPVTIEVALDDRFQKARSRTRGAFVFGLASIEQGIKLDRGLEILWISRCEKDVIIEDRVYPAGTTWLLVRGDQERPHAATVVVRARIVLPVRVDASIGAFTQLSNGDAYIGTWVNAPEERLELRRVQR